MRKHILIADRDPFSIHLLWTLLNQEGYAVTTASNGRQVQESIVKSLETAAPFDLLITDVEMPYTNGVEFIENILGNGMRLPVIVITSNDDGHLLKEFKRIGVVKYFIKPIDCDEILKEVAQVFERNI